MRFALWRRMSVRARLTTVYGTVLVLTEAVLLTIVYMVMKYASIRITDLSPLIDVNGTAVLASSGAATGMRPTTRQGVGIAKTDVLATLGWASAISLVAVTGVGLLVCWLVAGRVLSPLSRITAAAKTASAGTLHERIGLAGPDDELKQLADTFDGMLARLEREFEANRRFAANASHELRTPLAVTRTMLQVAIADPNHHDLRELGPKLLATNERGIAATEALLVLATAQHGDIKREVADLSSLAADVAAAVRAEAKERNVDLEARIAAVSIDGDPVLLRQLLLNLVQNAVRHNRPGGSAEVTVAGRTLVVANTGPVVPADSIEALFEPFHRVKARTSGEGHGLGLAIVRAIADAHGATVQTDARAGGGLVITVRF